MIDLRQAGRGRAAIFNLAGWNAAVLFRSRARAPTG